MYLFYVVDGLDIKKIEKKMKKMIIFVPKDFFPIITIFFWFFPRADIIPIMINATLV